MLFSQDNCILSLKELGHQPELVNLHAQRNSVLDFAEVRHISCVLMQDLTLVTRGVRMQVDRYPKLHEVFLEGNPVVQMDMYA